MKLNIIPLIAEDYENILCKWWKDWGWDSPSKDFLPFYVLNLLFSFKKRRKVYKLVYP